MTLDRSKVWTGDLNAKALEPQPRVTVGLYDTTLRDGEQTVGVVFSPEQKLEIATALSHAGVDRIEAGFPRVSEDDARAISLILEAGLDAEIWGFSRAVRADVEALVELGVQASVIESPISDGKLAALGVSRETMLERIRAAVSFAVGEGIRVAFFGVDSTRADLEFVRQVVRERGRGGRAGGRRRRHARHRDARGRGVPRHGGRRAARLRGARPLARPRRLRARDGGGRRGGAGRRDLGAGHGERDGGARRQRGPGRGRARARGAVRHPDAARPRAGTRRSARSCRSSPARSSRPGSP